MRKATFNSDAAMQNPKKFDSDPNVMTTTSQAHCQSMSHPSDVFNMPNMLDVMEERPIVG